MGCSALCRFVTRKFADSGPKSATPCSNVCKGFRKSHRSDIAEKFQLQQPHSACCNWNFSTLSDRWDFRKPLQTFGFWRLSVALFLYYSLNLRSPKSIPNFHSSKPSRCTDSVTAIKFLTKTIVVACTNITVSIKHQISTICLSALNTPQSIGGGAPEGPSGAPPWFFQTNFVNS